MDGKHHASSFHLLLSHVLINFRFLYVRLMLYRPLLSRFWSTVHHGATRSTQGRSRASSPMPRGGSSSLIQSTFASECCKLCVAYSMQLISLTHQSFLTPHTTSWWWNALCKYTLVRLQSFTYVRSKRLLYQRFCVYPCTFLPASSRPARCRRRGAVLAAMPGHPREHLTDEPVCAKVAASAAATLRWYGHE